MFPHQFRFVQNFIEVVEARDYMLVIAFINSTILTVASVTGMVVLAAMAGFVLQRRKSRWNGFINFLVLAGLIIPPAVVPTTRTLTEVNGCRDAESMTRPETLPVPACAASGAASRKLPSTAASALRVTAIRLPPKGRWSSLSTLASWRVVSTALVEHR